MKCFSFSIYGTDLKYIYGLLENIKIIRDKYPEFDIYLYVGENSFNNELTHIKETYSNVHFFNVTNKNSYAIARYLPLTFASLDDIIVIRDTDSEINERDLWCINDFKSITTTDNNICVQVIRDHSWHKSTIMAGLSMFIIKTNEFKQIINDVSSKMFSKIYENNDYTYGYDEKYLNSDVYQSIKEYILVYSNIIVYKGEKYKNISFNNDGVNFCGNVVEYTANKQKSYKFNYFEHKLLSSTLDLLLNNGQFDLILKVIDDFKPYITGEVLDYKYIAHYYKNEFLECMKCLKQFYKYNITDHIKHNSNYLYDLLRRNGYSIIGTCDLSIEPKPNEIIIYYGNYPDDYNALPHSNKVYSNVQNVGSVQLTKFIYDECWNDVDCIYIMGLKTNLERINRTMAELSHMNAPLNKIHKYIAEKDKNKEDIYLSVTKNHLDCISHMKQNNYKCCLFLEDDFTFTSNYTKNKENLNLFFKRNYDYHICFLAASKFHKREDYDDLLILSKQVCTTSSAYLLNYKTLDEVYNTINEGYELLKKEPTNHGIYCIDRYWCCLQKNNKMFIFKNKLGFQCPNNSNITGNLNYMLD
jgi:hypothetical protein